MSATYAPGDVRSGVAIRYKAQVMVSEGKKQFAYGYMRTSSNTNIGTDKDSEKVVAEALPVTGPAADVGYTVWGRFQRR